MDASTGRRLHAWYLDYPDYPRAVRFTGDGRHLLIATGVRSSRDGFSNAIQVRDARTGRTELYLTGHRHKVNCLAVSRRHKRIISGSEDGTVRVWEIP